MNQIRTRVICHGSKAFNEFFFEILTLKLGSHIEGDDFFIVIERKEIRGTKIGLIDVSDEFFVTIREVDNEFDAGVFDESVYYSSAVMGIINRGGRAEKDFIFDVSDLDDTEISKDSIRNTALSISVF